MSRTNKYHGSGRLYTEAELRERNARPNYIVRNPERPLAIGRNQLKRDRKAFHRHLMSRKS